MDPVNKAANPTVRVSSLTAAPVPRPLPLNYPPPFRPVVQPKPAPAAPKAPPPYRPFQQVKPPALPPPPPPPAFRAQPAAAQPTRSVTFPPPYLPGRANRSAQPKPPFAGHPPTGLPTGKPACCAACAARRAGPACAAQPAMRAWSAIQPSAKVVKGRAPSSKPKVEWKPGDKKAKKEKAGKRAAAKVAVAVAEKVKSCEETVQLGASFNAHVLSGEASGLSHVGYHSENATTHAAFGACVSTGAADGNGIYKASCTKTGKTVAKESTFFPAGWNIERIRTETKYAYCHQVAKGGINGAAALSWVGNNSDGSFMIGGADSDPISTAFPSYNGGFL